VGFLRASAAVEGVSAGADAALPRLFSEEAQQALDLTWYRPLRAEQIDRQTKTVRLSNGTHLVTTFF
jgi:ABC-type sulfate transport system substrate-binding protein